MKKPVCILMADDDEDDRLMARDALRQCRVLDCLNFVEDGEELMDYLHRRGKFADPASSPQPDLILLDLNMPRMDGREALREIKADPNLRRIPIVILTTSRVDADIIQTYDLGASSYIVKPVSFEGLVQVMKDLGQYWFQVVQLCPKGPGQAAPAADGDAR